MIPVHVPISEGMMNLILIILILILIPFTEPGADTKLILTLALMLRTHIPVLELILKLISTQKTVTSTCFSIGRNCKQLILVFYLAYRPTRTCRHIQAFETYLIVTKPDSSHTILA